ncbi:MAG: hypothetical protein ACRDT6_06090 [Micromonosporaceae bacterium]
MRTLGRLVGLSVIALAFAAPTAAHAATAQTNLVDGTVVSGSTTCSWVNASTSANPPSTLTVDRSSVSITCSDSTQLTLNNDPVVSFDDAAGTATVDAIDITAVRSGITCRYKASNLSVTRSGTTRTYSGGPYTGTKIGGSWLCPSSQRLDSATVTFR